MNFSLKQLEYFVAAAEHGNISFAAKQLHVSQPSVSNAISLLEERFDVQLVHRHPAKGISLTNIGRNFCIEARSLLNQAGELSKRTTDLSGSLIGNLDIGCFVTFAPFYIPGLLAGFNADHPGITVNLVEGALDTLQAQLFSGEIEVAMLYDISLDEGLATQAVASLPPYVLLSENHPLATRRSLSLSELEHQDFILLDLPHSRDYFLSLFLRAGVEPRIAHTTTSIEMVRGMVSSGLGYSILSLRPKTNRSYDGTALICKPLRDSGKALSIVIAQVKGARLSARAQAFVTHCESTFPNA